VLKTLEQACKVSTEVGLNYAHMENVLGLNWENPRCPNCGVLLFKHLGSEIKRWRQTKDMRFPDCGHTIAIEDRFNPSGFSHPLRIDLNSFP
jgi:ribosomal protein S27AE